MKSTTPRIREIIRTIKEREAFVDAQDRFEDGILTAIGCMDGNHKIKQENLSYPNDVNESFGIYAVYEDNHTLSDCRSLMSIGKKPRRHRDVSERLFKFVSRNLDLINED